MELFTNKAILTLPRLFSIILLTGFSLMAFGQNENRSYSEALQNIESRRIQFQEEFLSSDSLEKINIISTAKAYLFENIVDTVFPYWYGTKWDFNGHTRIPGTGTIACGYFITNTLTDAGFKIPRIKWAQSASEVFIKILADGNIRRFSNTPLRNVEEFLNESGSGLYLAGLDCHVRFIVVRKEGMRFVHANYYQPGIGVMSEKLYSWNPLHDSEYRVLGKLLSDEMVINWLKGISYE